MPAALLSARFTDQELALRKQARTDARRTLPNPAATARVLALAICEVEAGLRLELVSQRWVVRDDPAPWRPHR
jgi:hypothetical protein